MREAKVFLAETATSDVLFFAFAILLTFVLLFVLFLIGIKIRSHPTSSSPYSGLPLRYASELPYQTAKKVLEFLYERQEYDNRIIDLKRAAFCRETGRIFPDCVTWFHTIRVDWNFLKKRYPGSLVSWGSLSDIQKEMIRNAHDSIEGFQTEYSSTQSSPRVVERHFALSKPGPLYVDIDRKYLVGWQCVPDTELEVLIIQKPKRWLYTTLISEEEQYER